MSLISISGMDNRLYKLKLNAATTPNRGRAKLLLRGTLADGRNRPIKSTLSLTE